MLSAFLFAAGLVPCSIIDSASHDTLHYTQGLFFDGNTLYETTGEYGASRLFRYPAPGSSASDSATLESRYFGEGSVKLGSDVFWLTWREGTAFIYDATAFVRKASFQIPTEGWGLSLYRGSLLMSDGSSTLYYLSPGDKRIFQTVPVRDGKSPVERLNELEVVGDVLYANVWQSDSIAVIDLENGIVRGWIDLSGVAKKVRSRSRRAEVLNGIAFDGKHLWITGKNWPVMYKLKLNYQNPK